MADIEVVIKIPEEIRLALINNIQLSLDQQSICDSCIKQAIVNGTPLPNVLSELQRELFMNVDGGTDDKYVRCVDVCDRIEKTIKEFADKEGD